MVEYRISDFCIKYSQIDAAKIIGCTQSAVSQMIAANRGVYIVEHDDGTYTYFEKSVPGKKAA